MKLLEIFIMTFAGIWQGIRQDFNLLELAAIALAAAAWTRGWRPPAIRMPRVSDHPVRWAFVLALGFVLLRLALLPVLPQPAPRVTDEHSHLLLADTFMQGRLTNPVHPFWEHFESLHIIMRPHYASNYFPAHALWLAAGIFAAHSAWAGILAEFAVFLLALFWALRGWIPARWALFGVLLAGLRFGIGSYWINAFHGGFLAATGGALLLGAYPRLLKRPQWIDGLALGGGLALLMSTRPFEGFFCSVPVVLGLLWTHRTHFGALVRISIPAVLLTGLAAVGLGVYFRAVTGNPFVTTYQISQKTYGWPMALAWATPPRIENRHLELAHYYQYEIDEHEKVSDIPNFIEYLTFRLQEYWRFFVGPVLTIPLLFVGRVWRRRRIAVCLICGGLAAILLEGAASPHYLAPATAAIVLLIVEGCRHLLALRGISPMLFPASIAVILALRIGLETVGLPYTQAINFQSWCCRVDANKAKLQVAKQIEQIDGPHLVLVRAKKDPYNFEQWIYNAAEIDAARIVWARDLGPEKNAELRRYFQNRKVWMLDPNVDPPTLTAATD